MEAEEAQFSLPEEDQEQTVVQTMNCYCRKIKIKLKKEKTHGIHDLKLISFSPPVLARSLPHSLAEEIPLPVKHVLRTSIKESSAPYRCAP